MARNSTDEALMGAVRDGAHAGLRELFDRHHRSLYEFFFRMSGDRPASENLVQDVFVRILKYRDTFRDGGVFKAWLFRMARNAHHDYYRNHPVSSPAPIHGADIPKALQSALLQLPEDRRELIVLSQFQGLSPEEIAELLDIELPAASVRVHRAMLELRELYRSKLPGRPENGTHHAV